ncbi:hypothetical protein XHC_2961 [Xanthomonas hortorum pv. carotae str. M081]|nr:hypothetical protein XHC_2961 [Xanthomonas hortorum pv. carotae str. M081]
MVRRHDSAATPQISRSTPDLSALLNHSKTTETSRRRVVWM